MHAFDDSAPVCAAGRRDAASPRGSPRQPRSRHRGTAFLAALLPAIAVAAPGLPGDEGAKSVLDSHPPAAGVYDASLCVLAAPAPRSCGPVIADLDADGKLYLRISDIVYRLEPYGGQLGVSLFHGTMQIDGFFAPFRWNGKTLQFVDDEKTTRYEVSLGTRRFDPR